MSETDLNKKSGRPLTAATSDTLDDNEVESLFQEESDSEVENNPLPVASQTVEEKYTTSQLRVVRTNMDFSLHMLKDVNSKEWINRSPDYQRRHRWDDTKRSLLIESVLMNIPIPPLFLYENEYNQYEVMDGRQRLDTVIGFLNNNFALRGLEFWKELDGKRFVELPLTIQRGLLRRTVSAVVLLAETSLAVTDEDDIRMVMFRRLNTGGASLNPQELRNALYPGNFNRAMRELARTEPFTRIWGIPAKHLHEDIVPSPTLIQNPLYKTMADCELVLRFFAIRETISGGQKGSLRKLLDNTMKRHMHDSMLAVESLKANFTQSLVSLDRAFDNKPFRLPSGRLSRPLYDALMVSQSLYPKNDLHKENVQAALDKALANSETYEILTGKGNTAESIISRVSLARDILVSV